MTIRFPPAQQEAMRCLLGHGPGTTSAPIADVRRVLNRAPLRHTAFVGPQCWLAGGSVLRWLRGEPNADFDFYFPSLDALNDTAAAMMARGYRLQAFLIRPRTLAARLAARLGRTPRLAGESTGLVPITPTLVARHGLAAVELRSPEGDTIQLAAVFVRPTPFDVIADFDLSVAQFAADDRLLYCGTHAHEDLLRNRVRVMRAMWPIDTLKRLARYVRRGFRPHPSVVAVLIRDAVWRSRDAFRTGAR